MQYIILFDRKSLKQEVKEEIEKFSNGYLDPVKVKYPHFFPSGKQKHNAYWEPGLVANSASPFGGYWTKTIKNVNRIKNILKKSKIEYEAWQIGEEEKETDRASVY